jgi:hypothetical protein
MEIFVAGIKAVYGADFGCILLYVNTEKIQDQIGSAVVTRGPGQNTGQHTASQTLGEANLRRIAC